MVVKIRIPIHASPHVDKGQKVACGDPFYSTSKQADIVIPLAQELGIQPKLIFQYSRVVVGSDVKSGDILGSAKKFLGTKNILSEYDGVVAQIDHEGGNVTLKVASEEQKTFKTFFTGTIEDIDLKNGIVLLDIGKAKDYESKITSSDFGGEYSTYDEKEYFSIGSDDIQSKVILIKTIHTHIESKLDALDASGIIYVNGTAPTALPYATIKDSESFDKMSKDIDTYTYLLVSSHDKKIYAYN